MPATKAKPRSAKVANAKAKTYDNKVYREYERPGPDLSSDPEDNAFMREILFPQATSKRGVGPKPVTAG
jgi:hypothetical protein